MVVCRWNENGCRDMAGEDEVILTERVPEWSVKNEWDRLVEMLINGSWFCFILIGDINFMILIIFNPDIKKSKICFQSNIII